MWLRQSTASQEILLGVFLDSTDGNTTETGLTIANTDIKLWKEGATTEANKNSGGATHIAGGRYYAVLDATDSNTLGKLEINVHVAGALAVRREFMVVPAVVYDALVLGTDNLNVGLIATATSAQLVNDVWDEPLTGATHNAATSAGRRLRVLGDVVSGSVNDASATISSFISDLTGTHDDHFGDQTLYFTSGNLAGMSRIITTYISSTKEVTFDEEWPEAPANGDDFDVNPIHVHTKDQLSDAIWDELTNDHTINNTYGKILKGISEGWVADEGSVNDASATTTTFVSDLTNTTTSFFSDATVVFITGALKGQSRLVLTYNGTTKAFVFDEAFTSAPADTDQFIVLAQHNHTLTSIEEGVRIEIDANSTQLAKLGIPSVDISADIANIPTVSEFEARTPSTAELAYIVSNSADGLPVTFTGGTTTTAILGNVDGAAASSTDDVYNGRILIFNAGTLNQQATDITDYDGATKTATITAVTTAVTSGHIANLK